MSADAVRQGINDFHVDRRPHHLRRLLVAACGEMRLRADSETRLCLTVCAARLQHQARRRHGLVG